MTASVRPSGDREALVEAIANALPLGYGPRDPHANVFETAAALLDGPVGVALAQARAEAVREFVQHVAINCAYNGSGYPGQALYNEGLNAWLPDQARDYLARREERRERGPRHPRRSPTTGGCCDTGALDLGVQR